MGSSREFCSLGLLLVVGLLLLGFCEGYKFFAGGRDGWVLNPSENYNHWAERNRFQVNDTIVFKYKKGSDSVLMVNKDNYYSCNINNPIQSLTDGDSTLVFDRSGPFFFISGNEDNCKKGQRLIVVVMAMRPPKSINYTAPPPHLIPLAPSQFGPANSPTESPTSPEDGLDGPTLPPPSKSMADHKGFSATSALVVFGTTMGLIMSTNYPVGLISFLEMV